MPVRERGMWPRPCGRDHEAVNVVPLPNRLGQFGIDLLTLRGRRLCDAGDENNATHDMKTTRPLPHFLWNGPFTYSPLEFRLGCLYAFTMINRFRNPSEY